MGIICLTPDNLGAPWILFEAGAISKGMRDSRAYTFLFDLDHTDIKGPLAQFNHTKAEKEDTKKLLNTINTALGTPEGSLLVTKEILDVAFETFWPELEKALKNVPPQSKVIPPTRKQEDKIDDILTVVRRLEKESISPRYTQLEPWALVRTPTGEYKMWQDVGEIEKMMLRYGATITEPLKPEGDGKDKEDKEDKDE